MEELENLLSDLVAIATRRKPGQVTHKIADIKELWKSHEHAVVQQAKKESGLRSCMEIEQQVLYDDFLREPFKKRVLESIERVKSKYLPEKKSEEEQMREILADRKLTRICKHCRGEIKIRNPKGFCDHLYYPENCETCKSEEKKYPCRYCGKLRTKAEGGTTFTYCDECWDKKTQV